jgi:hypothetical protein
LTEFLKRVTGWVAPGAELYRKLSRLERVSVFLVAAVVLLALAGVLLSGRGSGEKDGSPAMAVVAPRGQDADTSVSEGGSFLESPRQHEARLRRASRKKLERAILCIPKIKNVDVMISSARPEPYVGRKTSSGRASVMLTLQQGVTVLTRGEAEAVRDMVRGAFNLESDKVSISDNHAHRYEWSGGDELEEKGAAQRSLIRKAIEEHYAMVFEEDEFSVVVMVSLSKRRQRSEKKETDRDRTFVQMINKEVHRGPRNASGGIMGSSGPTVEVAESTEGVLCDSWEKTLTVIPSGELKGVGVLVQFDLRAVERVLGPDPPPDTSDIKTFVAQQEKTLSRLLDVHSNVSAGVVVSPFARRSPRDEPVPTTAKVVELSAFAALTSRATRSPVWTALAVAGLLVLLTLVFSVFARLRSRSRAKSARLGTLPELSQEAAPSPHTFESSSRFGFSSAQPDGIDPCVGASNPRAAFASGTLQDGLLGTVDDAGSSVRERPEIASSVLRLWLAQDETDSPEGGMQG